MEYYYGADARLDVLRQRLRSIYLDSFDIDRIEVAILKKLIQPVKYRPAEYKERAEEGRLLDPDPIESLTDRSGSVGADGGTIRAPPSLEDVTPYGVRWRGSVARRKDWMTSLTAFSEAIENHHGYPKDDDHQSGRAPLAPLSDQLTKASHPLAFQVVFRRRSDWSRDARRRAGELLDGTDTLLQKVLSLESPGERRRSSSRRNPQRQTRRTSRGSAPRRANSSPGDGPSRPTDVESTSRYDQVRENSPKRGFEWRRTTGDHAQLYYEHPTNEDDCRWVTVPLHDELRTGTLRDIAESAGAQEYEAFCD